MTGPRTPRRTPRSAQARTLADAHGRTVGKVLLITMLAIVLLAGTGATIRAIRGPTSQPLSPADIARLTPAWTAPNAGPVAGAALGPDAVYVGAGDGIVAYPTPCTPQDRVCAPMWHDVVPDGPLSAPAVDEDVVVAGSAGGRVYAFPTHCPAADCPPLWSGAAGTGAVPTPAYNEDFVYAATGKVYAFPSHCGSTDRDCPPAWVGAIPGRAAGSPAAGAGLVVVASDSLTGGVLAFPAVCTGACAPAWEGSTGGPAAGVALSSDTAYVVARGTLFAFPLSCKGPCVPRWTARFLPSEPFAAGAVSAPEVAGNRIYVGASDGTLWMFSASCDQTLCAPVAHYDLGTDPLFTPATAAGVTYVTSAEGILTAVPQDCGACTPWANGLGAKAIGPPTAGDEALFAGDAAGTLHAYEVPRR
jgi:nitrite reductase/ring-hydroxylating ferredoxin subunit